MFDNIIEAILKHRRVLILALDNKNEGVITAILEELKKTENLPEQIEKAAEEFRKRINGK